MLVKLSLIYIVMTVLFIGYKFIKNDPIKKEYNYIIWLVFTLALGIIAYNTIPSVYDDLFRHYEELQRMRYGGIAYLSDPTQAVYNINFIINYIYYFIAMIGNYKLLPFILTIVTYAIFFIVSIKIMEKLKCNYSTWGFFLVLFFTMVSVRLVTSGLRNWFAFSIIYIAVYRDYFNQKKDIFTLILYILPMFIHSSAVIILAIRILSIENIRRFKLYYIIPFWSLLSGVISNIFMVIPNEFIYSLGEKIQTYLGFEMFDIRFLVTQTIFVICITVINIVIFKDKLNTDENLDKYLYFVQNLSLFSLGCVILPQLLGRMVHFIAYLMLPTIYYLNKIDKKSLKYGIYGLFIILILGLSAFQLWDGYLNWRVQF